MNYLHSKALKALKSTLPVIIAIAGRGWSKSTLVGADVYENATQMPRSLGSLWGLTYKQLLTKVMPSAKKMLAGIGLILDRPGQPGHYVIGRKPPPYYKRPINEPLLWENTMTFMNGSCLEFISADRPELIAGGSYDYEIFDEAVYFPKEVHDTKAIPSLRGNVQYFGKCPRHGRRLYVGSQAWDPEGYWVEDQKWLKDEEGQLVLDENGDKVLDPETLFIHGTSHDNVAIITEKRLKLWRQTLPGITYDIEILAKRLEKGAFAYYEEFHTKRHTYINSIEYGYNYEENEFGVYVKKQDKDRDGRLPLLLGFDFGTSFNSCVVGQYHKGTNEIRIINVFFESSNQLLSKLVKPLMEAYKNHGTKRVELYGDPSGNKRQQMETHTLFQQIANYLRADGWTVINNMTGKAYPLHRIRKDFINKILQELDPRMPRVRINYHKGKYLLTSFRIAKVDKNGGKDKSSERDKKRDQKTATHISDAFDYLVYYKFYGKVGDVSVGHSPVRLGKRIL